MSEFYKPSMFNHYTEDYDNNDLILFNSYLGMNYLLRVSNKKKDKIINARNLIALIPALIVTCVGYYLADRILFGAWGAFAAVIPNVIQVAANAAIYVIFGLALDAAGFKKKVLK